MYVCFLITTCFLSFSQESLIYRWFIMNIIYSIIHNIVVFIGENVFCLNSEGLSSVSG